MKELGEFVQRHEVFRLVVGGIHELSGILRGYPEVLLDQAQHTVEFAFLEHVIGARDVQHQHGGGRTYSGFPRVAVCLGRGRRDRRNHLVDKSLDHLLPGVR